MGNSTQQTPDAVREAKKHAVELEQCSLFVDSPPLAKAMTDAAAFLRTFAALDSRAGDAREAIAWMRRCAFDKNEGTKGNRPKGWSLHAVTTDQLLPDDVPLYAATPAPAVDAQEEAEHIRQTEMHEIADGAYGDGPATRGAARDYLATVDAVPAGETSHG